MPGGARAWLAVAALLVAAPVFAVPNAHAAGFAQDTQNQQQPPAKSHTIAPRVSPSKQSPGKHGGESFTSKDKRHRIEGVLLPAGTFRLYVYGADLEPVSAAELKQTTATVQWGDSELAPRTQLAPMPDGTALDSAPRIEVKLPITLTLRIAFAGAPRGAKPEVFTFRFTQFSAPGEDTPAKPPREMRPAPQTPSEHPMPPTDRSADTLEHRPGH